MLEALLTIILQIGPPDWLIDFLVELTGKNLSLYTTQDLARFVAAVVILGYAAARNSQTAVDHAWKALYIVGIPLLLYTMIFRGTLSLVLQGAANILFVTGISVFAIKLGFLSNNGAKLLTGVALLIPTYPFLTVFPLKRSILPLPLNMFAFTIMFYFALLVLVYGTFNLIRTRDFTDTEPLFRFIGKPVDPANLHSQNTLILQGEHGIAFDLKTSELQDYVEWSDSDSIAEVNRVYADKFVKSQLEEPPDDEIVEAFQNRLEWLSEQDQVWVLRTPGLSRFLFIATLLAMFFGDIILHAIL